MDGRPNCSAPLDEIRPQDDEPGAESELEAYRLVQDPVAQNHSEKRLSQVDRRHSRRGEALEKPGLKQKREPGDDKALVGERGRERRRPSRRLFFDAQAGKEEAHRSERGLSEEQFRDGDALRRPGEDNLAGPEKECRPDEQQVSSEGHRHAFAGTAGKDRQHSQVGDEGPESSTVRQTIAGNEEVSEDRRPERIGAEDDGRVSRARSILTDVHERDLGREQQTEPRERRPFPTRNPERFPAREREAYDDERTEEKPQEPEPKRGTVAEPHFDRDGVSAPEGGEEEGEAERSRRESLVLQPRHLIGFTSERE